MLLRADAFPVGNSVKALKETKKNTTASENHPLASSIVPSELNSWVKGLCCLYVAIQCDQEGCCDFVLFCGTYTLRRKHRVVPKLQPGLPISEEKKFGQQA